MHVSCDSSHDLASAYGSSWQSVGDSADGDGRRLGAVGDEISGRRSDNTGLGQSWKGRSSQFAVSKTHTHDTSINRKKRTKV